jgi:hypothetical protein
MILRRKFTAKAAPFARTPAKRQGARPDKRHGRRNVGHIISDGIRELAQTFARAFDPYRPELHYMRGPGPKWHAKWADHPTQGPSPADVHNVAGTAGAHA